MKNSMLTLVRENLMKLNDEDFLARLNDLKENPSFDKFLSNLGIKPKYIKHDWDIVDNYPHDASATYTCKVCGDVRSKGIGWGNNTDYPCLGAKQP